MDLAHLPAFDPDTDELNAIIETPQGSRNKYTWDPKKRLFKLSGVLTLGAVFPFDFGFVPSTLGEDGDPVDVLVLMDEPAFPGCLVPARLIGIIEAEQTEAGETGRNNRLIAVASNSRNHRDVRTLDDLSGNRVEEIEYFFVSYNRIKGKEFSPRGRFGPERAREAVSRGCSAFRNAERDGH